MALDASSAPIPISSPTRFTHLDRQGGSRFSLAWLAGEEPALGLEPRAAPEPVNAGAPGGRGFAMTSPSRDQTRGGWACASGEPSRTPSTKSHQQILDVQKKAV